jgi:hypothetical protein
LPREEKPAAPPASAAGASSAPPILKLELLNAKTWLTGKRALLQIAVRDQASQLLDGAIVTARVEGAAVPTELSTVTGSLGRAQLDFEMPSLTTAEAAVVIEAFKGNAKGQLRFQLRAKSRVPSVS